MPLSLEDATNPANQASQASQIPPPNAASILETIIEESDNGHMLNFVSHYLIYIFYHRSSLVIFCLFRNYLVDVCCFE